MYTGYSEEIWKAAINSLISSFRIDNKDMNVKKERAVARQCNRKMESNIT